MAGGRCAEPGCGRFVGRREVFCGRHADGAAVEEGRGAGGAAGGTGAGVPAGDGREAAPRRGGEGPGARLAAALARAAADPGLDEEVGALRLTLARLLREEEADPLKVATAVARLAAVGVQAARTRRALAEDGPDELLAAVESWLEE